MRQVLFPGDELPLRFLSEQSLDSIREQLSSEGALLAVLATSQVLSDRLRRGRRSLVRRLADTRRCLLSAGIGGVRDDSAHREVQRG